MTGFVAGAPTFIIGKSVVKLLLFVNVFSPSPAVGELVVWKLAKVVGNGPTIVEKVGFITNDDVVLLGRVVIVSFGVVLLLLELELGDIGVVGCSPCSGST